MALGISGRPGDYKLAVRIQRTIPGMQATIANIQREARGEVDVRHVGTVVKQQPWHRRRNRPLLIGGSVGHVRVTAGTLGCFVTPAAGARNEDFILSNNHVLANENDAAAGDAVLQPGKADGGHAGRDVVGELSRFVRLKPKNNRVDAALASLKDGIEYYPNWLEGIGEITGQRDSPPEIGERVMKVGRTTGVTVGRISAVEIDDLLVEYDMGVLSFNGQIEIAREGSEAFSLGGDSGSLIVDRQRKAIGLLFAGNDADVTYANPIQEVFDSLRIVLSEAD
jgi:hypothetical protein